MGSSQLNNAILVNVAYPTPRNGRGKREIPEASVGAATLPLLAALVHVHRPRCRVRAYDEIGTPVDFDHIDGLPRRETLVLMSVRTSLAEQAKLMAQRFQALGFAVVMGGPHASACLDEVAGYANAAVHGEAEVHLLDVIEAFEAGALHAGTRPGLRFRADRNCNLETSPIPERGLYGHSRTFMHPGVLEFSRGCQFGCSFCASTNLYTNTVRHKRVEQILAEIDTLPVYPGGRRAWFFGDDNFAACHARAKDLSLAIGRRFPKARWGAAMTIASAKDESLLDALAEGGLRYAFIGFDSIVQSSLRDARKKLCPVEHYAPLVQALRERGIFVVAALVLGFDHDRVQVFEDVLRWSLASGVDVLNLNVLRPYPSSPMYRELKRQGRLLRDPWWLEPFEERLRMVHGLTPNPSNIMTTFQPLLMSPRELAEGTLWLGREFHRTRRVLPRLARGFRGLTTLVMDGLITRTYARQYRTLGPVRVPQSTPSGERLERFPEERSVEA